MPPPTHLARQEQSVGHRKDARHEGPVEEEQVEAEDCVLAHHSRRELAVRQEVGLHPGFFLDTISEVFKTLLHASTMS